MELKDFPYTTTNRLVKYSKLVTKAIASFNRNNAFKLGTITFDPYNRSPPNEDLLKYWEETSEDITFGRYLLYTPKKENNEEKENKKNKDVIPFWTGISSTHTETIFCIWFEKNDISQYIAKLEEKFQSNLLHKSKGEIWILMDRTDFDKFCDSDSCAHCRRQILKKFWKDVLGAL
jgi:hypothetical protein